MQSGLYHQLKIVGYLAEPFVHVVLTVQRAVSEDPSIFLRIFLLVLLYQAGNDTLSISSKEDTITPLGARANRSFTNLFRITHSRLNSKISRRIVSRKSFGIFASSKWFRRSSIEIKSFIEFSLSKFPADCPHRTCFHFATSKVMSDTRSFQHMVEFYKGIRNTFGRFLLFIIPIYIGKPLCRHKERTISYRFRKRSSRIVSEDSLPYAGCLLIVRWLAIALATAVAPKSFH